MDGPYPGISDSRRYVTGVSHMGIEKLKAGLLEILLVVLVIVVLVLAAGFFLLFIGALMFPEEKKLDNGLLEVRYATFRETEVYECRFGCLFARTAGKPKESSRKPGMFRKFLQIQRRRLRLPGAGGNKSSGDAGRKLSGSVRRGAVETYSISRPGYNAKRKLYSVLEEGTAK